MYYVLLLVTYRTLTGHSLIYNFMRDLYVYVPGPFPIHDLSPGV